MIQHCLSFPKNWKQIEFIIFSIHKNFREGKGEENTYVFHLLPTHSSLLRWFFPSVYSMPSTHQRAEKHSMKQTWYVITDKSANSIPSLITWTVHKLRFSSFLSFYINWQFCTKKFSFPLNTWNMLQSALLFTSVFFGLHIFFMVLFFFFFSQNNSQATSDSTFHFDLTSINIFKNSMSRAE